MKETLIAAALILVAYLGLYIWGNRAALKSRNCPVPTPLAGRTKVSAIQGPERMMQDNRAVTSAAEILLLAAFLTALAATLGALFIGEVLGQMPCTLCWYQRIAMFPLVPVLAIGLWRGDAGAWFYALPLVSAGLAIALWHSGLYAGLIPETASPCTRDGPSCSNRAQMTIIGLPIPYLSLGAFAGIALCLGLRKGKPT